VGGGGGGGGGGKNKKEMHGRTGLKWQQSALMETDGEDEEIGGGCIPETHIGKTDGEERLVGGGVNQGFFFRCK